MSTPLVIQFGLRLAIVAAGAVGLSTVFGMTTGTVTGAPLAYFTVQSNLLVFGVYAALVIWAIAQWLPTRRLAALPDFPPLVMGAVMLAIAVTGVVYNLILAPTVGQANMGVASLADFILHGLVPSLVFIDWLFFGNQRALRWWAPFTWTLIPLAYVIFAIIRAQIGGPLRNGSYYAYPFLDVNVIGWGRMLLNTVVLVIAFLAGAWPAIGLGRLLQRFRQRDATPRTQ